MAKEGYPLSLQVQPRYGKSAKRGAPRRKRSEFPSGAAGRRVCIGSDSRGRNSVRSEGALGRRTWPVAYRRDLRRLKKCPLKNFEFPPTQEPISSKPSRPNQSLQRGQPVIHRGFTGPTRSQRGGMDTHERIASALKTIAGPNSLPLLFTLFSQSLAQRLQDAGPVTPPNTSLLSAATAGHSVVNARGC